MEKCSCIKKVVVTDDGKALLYPDYRLLANPSYKVSPLEGCYCPRSAEELARCLQGCLDEVIKEAGHKPSDIKQAFVVDEKGMEIKLTK